MGRKNFSFFRESFFRESFFREIRIFKVTTVIGKIFADKNFRDNNIGGTKMPSYGQHEGIFVPPILFPLRSANLFLRKYFNFTVYSKKSQQAMKLVDHNTVSAQIKKRKYLRIKIFAENIFAILKQPFWLTKIVIFLPRNLLSQIFYPQKFSALRYIASFKKNIS
jgi:hypothetical protein